MVDFVRTGFRVSERRACSVMGWNRRTYRYRSPRPEPPHPTAL